MKMISMRKRLVVYVLLAKPRIVLLVALTGISAMVLEGSLLAEPLRFGVVLLGIVLAAGSANAFNQFRDRDIDAVMARTRSRRPIPAGMIPPRHALYFGLAAGITAVLLLRAAGSALAAMLGLGAIFFYAVVYTLWLKRRTSLNIVIGGASGAAAPLIGWAAGAGELGTVPWLMFLVIFLWTPPHFWSLALYTREEYALAGIPMLPVVSGERTTRLHIAAYTAVLLPVTACLGISADLGWIFLIGTAVVGILLVRKVVILWIDRDDSAARALFLCSNMYLAAVFVFTLVSGW
ncbi:MAG: heme o synthase [Desulfobulbaceae bacterium]|nr:heme o synthase [Desulfobulbaceae bacterium]